MRVGSLFSGAGGLDLAVEQVFGGRTVWHCEQDAAASAVLAYRWPGVPNLGDITTVDWSAVEPADVLCGGYPCQPFSAAGRRKGTSDDRHLWPYFAEAVRCLRPRFVVLENVAGHRSMGFDSVLGDLASMRFDAQWCSVRASDVGAPHRRERLFVLAADTEGARRGIWDTTHVRTPDRELDASGHDSHTSTDASGDGRHEGWPESAGFGGGSDAAVGGHGPVDLLPTPVCTDAKGARNSTANRKPGSKAAIGDTLGDLIYRGELLPAPTSSDSKRNDCPSERERNTPSLVSIGHYLPTPNASDATGGGTHPDNREGHSRQLIDYALLHGSDRWGKYAPAIHHWETLTRPAPAPTEPNKNGNPRLAAAFAEWLMGWPAGWCTDPAIGISRNDQLRIVGNGVCPQQAVAAQVRLLSVCGVAA